MKVEIIERGVDVLLASRTVDGNFVCPRKNEMVHVGGATYVVREVKHFFYEGEGNEDFIEILVDIE